MENSDSQIDKPQRGRPKRVELSDVNINIGAQSTNTEPLIPRQTDSQVDASLQKPELPYGLAMGGQMDSQGGSQVQSRCKKWYISRIYS